MATLDIKQYEGMIPVASHTMGTLDFFRQRLVGAIKDLTPEQLLKTPAGFKNNIATLILHIGNTEINFAHRLMGKPVPDELKAEFPPHLPGQPLTSPEKADAADLIAKLEKSLGYVLEALQGLSEADLSKEHQMGPDRSATTRWILTVLANHQTQHFGQIQMIVQHF